MGQLKNQSSINQETKGIFLYIFHDIFYFQRNSNQNIERVVEHWENDNWRECIAHNFSLIQGNAVWNTTRATQRSANIK